MTTWRGGLQPRVQGRRCLREYFKAGKEREFLLKYSLEFDELHFKNNNGDVRLRCVMCKAPASQ
jgi:hypothetical protein